MIAVVVLASCLLLIPILIAAIATRTLVMADVFEFV